MSDNKAQLPITELKNILIKVLKDYYTNSERFRWSSDVRERKIGIFDAFPVDADSKELFPRIVLKRESFSPKSGHLTQKVYNNNQDKEQKMDLLQGSISLLCMSETGLEAEELAEDVFIFLSSHRDKIAEKGLFTIKKFILGEERVIKSGSDTDIVVVPVRFEVSIEHNWMVVETGDPLENFNINTTITTD